MTEAPRLAVRASATAFLLTILLAVSGCNVVDDLAERLESCHDQDVLLLNDEQTIDAVHVLGPDEATAPTTFLQSGQSRKITQCLELGHEYPFRAVSEDLRLLASVKCPVSRRNYDGITPTVSWTPIGFRCINW
jgi:hypothetical protein